MSTNYTSRASVTTTYWGRDPVGRKYLDNGQWAILTTEAGVWLIAVDSSNTVYTTNRWYTAQTLWEIAWTLAWMAWTLADYYTWILPTNYTSRIIP